MTNLCKQLVNAVYNRYGLRPLKETSIADEENPVRTYSFNHDTNDSEIESQAMLQI